jgi:hypothetical protein
MAPETAGGASDRRDVAAKRPRYLESIIGIFIIPATIFYFLVRKHIQWKPFWYAAVTVAVIGWAWSWTVTSHIWWSFGWPFMLGIDVLPNLPVEEVLFYPFGGILTIFIYIFVSVHTRGVKQKSGALYWLFLVIGSLFFGGIAYAARDKVPFYLYSQLLVYNLVCCLLLAPLIAKEMNLLAMSVPILLLGTTGFFWDYYAIKYGWWQFHAVTKIYLNTVPLDEFNFFFYGPPSAIAIYLAFCRLFGVPQITDNS